MKYTVAFLVIFAVLSVKSQTVPCVPVSSECANLIGYSQAFPVTTNITGPINTALAASQFCDNCVRNLKTLACLNQYPNCGCAGTSPNIVCTTPPLPTCGTSCTAAVNSCAAPLPAAFQSQVTTTLNGLIQAATGKTCASLSNTGCANFTSFTNISSCPCTTQALDAVFCGTEVAYSVSGLIAQNAPTIDGVAATLYNSQVALLNGTGFACSSCLKQIKHTICTSSFPACNTSISQFFLPPCTQVCNDFLNTCRVNQLLDPTFTQFAASLGITLPIANIQASVAACGAAPYSNGPCTSGSYTPEAECPCGTPTLSGVCKNYVNYQVNVALTSPLATATIEATVNASLSAMSSTIGLLCPSCVQAITEAACRTAFPQCTATQLAQPMCQQGCQALLSPCNLTSINKLICGKLPSTSCYNPPVNVTTSCNYCVVRSDLPTCGKYISYPTYAFSIPGFNLGTLDGIIGLLLTQYPIVIPNCSACAFDLTSAFCSTILYPCSNANVDALVASFVNFTGTPTTADFFARLSQPCYSSCNYIYSNCVTKAGLSLTANCNFPVPMGLGLPPGTLFSNASNCFPLNFGTLPPASCLPAPNKNDAMGNVFPVALLLALFFILLSVM